MGGRKSRQVAVGEIRYTLAGQIETPGSIPANPAEALDESVYSDVDYRRALGSKRHREDPESPAVRLSTLRYESSQASPSSNGWSALAFSAIGGVVGKVWEFCKEGRFEASRPEGEDTRPHGRRQKVARRPTNRIEDARFNRR